MASPVYYEDFDESPGGWIGWTSNRSGPAQLERRDSSIVTRSPWWIDYNHAPPGGGYLHVLFALQTKPHFNLNAQMHELGGVNRFIEDKLPTDFTNARVTLRLRGEVNLRGAQLLLLAQARVGEHFVNHTLVRQPFKVTSHWSEQTVQLSPDPMQWKCLGARHDRADFYGVGPIESVLRDLNNNIIIVLHPLDVQPLDARVEEPHLLRAGEDYAVDTSKLPSGLIMIDSVRIEFAGGA